jgi:hypothetical protein
VSILEYKPPPTVEDFMLSDARVRVIVGPIGSGKSMGCIMELLRRACEQEPYNGVRYTRFVCVRNTLQQLRQTVLADITQYLGPVVSYYSTDSTIRLRVSLPDGTQVHSDWQLIPLDTKEDVRRLLSLQITGAWINEAREIDMAIMAPLLGRTGRYPSKAMGGASWRGVMADTNPWSEDSAWHDALVLHPKANWRLYHQPSGVGPNAENIANLPNGYYDDLIDGKDSDFAAVHVESQWGTSNAGQAVFRRSFHAPDHAREMQAITNPHRPLMIGMDFGRTPCALICQVDSFGRLYVFKEVVTDDMGLEQMIIERLMPVLSAPPFVGRRVFVVADPAGNHKTEIREETAFSTLRDHGFLAYPAVTNDVDKRILAVNKLLLMRIAGEAGIQICREGCPTLVTAMGSLYRYKKKKDGQLEERPDKTHPWSDVADALQYACLGVQANLAGKVVARDTPRNTAPRFSAKAWT